MSNIEPDQSPKNGKGERPKRHEVWTLLDALSREHATMGAKLVELRAKVAAMQLPDARPITCPDCDLSFRFTWQMQEHRYRRHDGPLPDSYARAESLADLAPRA